MCKRQVSLVRFLYFSVAETEGHAHLTQEVQVCALKTDYGKRLNESPPDDSAYTTVDKNSGRDCINAFLVEECTGPKVAALSGDEQFYATIDLSKWQGV